MTESVSVGLRDPGTEIISNANRQTVVQLGPIQPRTVEFLGRAFGSRSLRFQPSWYTKYDWLEYSTSLDAALCFYCRCYGSLGKIAIIRNVVVINDKSQGSVATYLRYGGYVLLTTFRYVSW